MLSGPAVTPEHYFLVVVVLYNNLQLFEEVSFVDKVQPEDFL